LGLHPQNPADRTWWEELVNKCLSDVQIFRHCFLPLYAARKMDVISEVLIALLVACPIQTLTMEQAFDHA